MSQNKNVDIWIAGAIAAFTVDLIVYPLDTIKTRIQSPDYKRLYTSSASNGTSRSLFRNLYQGVGPVILATLPSSGAFFTTYEGVKYSLNGLHLLPQPLVHAAASGLAELVSCGILTPAEVIKQNAQMVDNSNTNKPRVNATLQTLQRFRSNPFALWRGYFALASRNLPFTALQFPIFERIRKSIQAYRDEHGIRTNTVLESGLVTAVSAGTGGSIAAVITTPVDVVKTRIMLAAVEGSAQESQSSPGRKSAKDAVVDATGKVAQSAKETVKETVQNLTQPSKKKGSLQIARDVMKEQGVKGLFRGGALRAVWTMMGSGLYLGCYESARLWLASRRGEHLSAEDLE